jgi:hypothetical protein
VVNSSYTPAAELEDAELEDAKIPAICCKKEFVDLQALLSV